MSAQNADKSSLSNEHGLKLTTRGGREIVLTRVFQAPRSLVFKAMTTPELVRLWLLGPPGWSMVNCEIDLKVGGVFRHEWCNSDGTKMGMHGVYREIVPSERIVNTESFDFGCAPQSGEQIATASLSEDQGQTTLRIVVLYPSREARDATIASGMEHGLAASYDRLAEQLTSTQQEGERRLR
jgi:uncharacterized protein YndB with AHSA1/START domain